MISAAFHALETLFTPPYWKWLLKSLLYTLGMLIILWVFLSNIIGNILFFEIGFLNSLSHFFAGFVLIFALSALMPIIASGVIGFFADDIAAQFEEQFYPQDPLGKAMSLRAALFFTLKFTLLLSITLLLTLPAFIFGIGFIILFLANSWLLGREYFMLIAMRHMDENSAKQFYAKNAGRVFIGGVIISLFTLIPFLNLITAAFAALFMVHNVKHFQKGNKDII